MRCPYDACLGPCPQNVYKMHIWVHNLLQFEQMMPCTWTIHMHVRQLQAINSSSTCAARCCLKPEVQLYLCAAQADPGWSGFALLHQRNRQPVKRLFSIHFAT